MSDALVGFLYEHTYVAVFLLTAAENVFPPIPSEVILPYIGHVAVKGELNIFLAFFVSVIGSLVGTLIWYGFGRLVSLDRLRLFFTRFGGYVAITLNDFNAGTDFFVKHKRKAVFWGRLIPGVRAVISIPAGSVRMPFGSFMFISTVGIATWNLVLISAGYFFLTDITVVQRYVNPISDLIIWAFVAAYLIKVAHFLWRREKFQNGG
jgi:membrane protein DedA with SNARE-associated domain